MKIDRYELRNTCFSMKKGKSPKYPQYIELVEPLIEEKNWSWHSFNDFWDVAIVNNEIRIIASIKNLSEVETVCAQKQMAVKLNAEPEFDERQTAIIESMEAQFLDGIMDWTNYRDEWIVRQDPDNKRILTKLIKRVPQQKVEITQEVLDSKIAEQLAETSGSSDTEEARESITPKIHEIVYLK
mgnify:CR=1 FL=1